MERSSQEPISNTPEMLSRFAAIPIPDLRVTQRIAAWGLGLRYNLFPRPKRWSSRAQNLFAGTSSEGAHQLGAWHANKRIRRRGLSQSPHIAT